MTDEKESAGKAGFEGAAADTPPPAAAPKKAALKYKTIAEILAELWGITASEIYANSPNTALFNNLTYIDHKADFVYVDQPALGISNIEITRDSVMIDDPITMETAMQLAAIAAANPAIRAQGVVTVGRNERETHFLTLAALYYKLDIKNPGPAFDDLAYSAEFEAAEKSVNGVAEVPPQLIPQEPEAAAAASVETTAAESGTPATTASAEADPATPAEPAKPAFTELNDDIREALYDQYLDTPTSSPATEGLSKEDFLALLDKRWAAMPEKEREFYAIQSKDYRQSKEPLPFSDEAGNAYIMNVYGMGGVPGRERDKIAARWTALPRDIQNQYLGNYREVIKQVEAARADKLAAEQPAEAAAATETPAPAAVAAAPADLEFKDKLDVEILDSPNLESLPFDEKAQKAYIDYLIQIKKDPAHATLTDTHKVNWVRLSTDSQKKILLRAGVITREEFEGKQPEAPTAVAAAPVEAAPEAAAPAAAPEAVSDNVLKRPLSEQVVAILKAGNVTQGNYKKIRRRVVESQNVTRTMISTEFNLASKDGVDAVYRALQEEQIIRRKTNNHYAVIPAEDGHARPVPT